MSLTLLNKWLTLGLHSTHLWLNGGTVSKRIMESAEDLKLGVIGLESSCHSPAVWTQVNWLLCLGVYIHKTGILKVLYQRTIGMNKWSNTQVGARWNAKRCSNANIPRFILNGMGDRAVATKGARGKHKARMLWGAVALVEPGELSSNCPSHRTTTAFRPTRPFPLNRVQVRLPTASFCSSRSRRMSRTTHLTGRTMVPFKAWDLRVLSSRW